MPSWIGPWELAILLVIVLLVFGPKRLPEMGKSLGKGMREFKDSITGNDKDEDDDKRVLPPTTLAVTEDPAATAPPAPARESEPTK